MEAAYSSCAEQSSGYYIGDFLRLLKVELCGKAGVRIAGKRSHALLILLVLPPSGAPFALKFDVFLALAGN